MKLLVVFQMLVRLLMGEWRPGKAPVQKGGPEIEWVTLEVIIYNEAVGLYEIGFHIAEIQMVQDFLEKSKNSRWRHYFSHRKGTTHEI